MLSDDGLRAALSARVESLDPHVEAELEGVMRRAQRRMWARRSAYAVGAIAASVAAVLVTTSALSPAQTAPEPADQSPIGTTLTRHRGYYAKPAPIVPGFWQVRFVDLVGIRARLVVDVPAGWGQDDDVALATGPDGRPTTRRLELSADPVGVVRGPCQKGVTPAEHTALGVAQQIAAVEEFQVDAVEAVTVAGVAGFRVNVRPSSQLPEQGLCREGVTEVITTRQWGSVMPLGWTAPTWLLDVDGHVLVITGLYGPEASPAEIAELIQMVETSDLLTP